MQPKINEKSTKNQSKIDQKSIKNRSKIDQKSTKNWSWRRLGVSWGLLGCLGGLQGRPEGVLATSWRRPGGSWGRPGGQHGSNLAPKTEPKSIKNRCKKRSKFWCFLGSVFYRIFLNFWYQHRPKLAPKWYQKSMSTLKAKNQLNASRLVFSWLSGVQVGR